MAGPFTLTFSTGITAPPGSGNFELNNAVQDLATTVWISNSTADVPSTDITAVLSAITVGQELYFQDQNDSTRWQQYQVTSLPVASSGYSTIAVQWIKGGLDLPPQRCAFSVIPAGQPTYPPPALGPAPVPPSAPGQAYPIYTSGSATSPPTPIHTTGSPIIPTSAFPPGGGVGSIGDPIGVPTFPPPTPPPIGTVPAGPLVGPAVAPAPVPPSTAGFPLLRYQAPGSATVPTAASLFPAFTTTSAYAGFPNQPPNGVPIVYANIWTSSTSTSITAATWATGQTTYTTAVAHGIPVGAHVTITGVTPSAFNGNFTTVTGTTGSTLVVSATTSPGTFVSGGTAVYPISVTPPSTATTAQIILNGWGPPGPSGLGPGPPGYPNPPGAGLPHVASAVSSEPQESGGGLVFPGEPVLYAAVARRKRRASYQQGA